MSHPDDDTLALLAMGETPESEHDVRHVAECPQCAEEVAELAHAAGVGRSSMVDGTLEAPPTDVWSRIHGELGLGDALAADPLRAAPVLAPAPTEATGTTADVAPRDPAPPTPEEEGRRARRPATRRPLRTMWVLAASAALVLAVGAGVWITTSLGAPVQVVAAAQLDAFPGHPGAAGSAEVDDDGDGARTLRVTLDADATGDGDYREVWLIRTDGQALISLGVLDEESGTFRVPDGVDLAEYALVDISVEPVDGDPAHSGDSIVRGELDFS